MVDISLYEKNANIFGLVIDELDKMYLAKVYFPYNNYEFVILRYNKFHFVNFEIKSKYSIYVKTKK